MFGPVRPKIYWESEHPSEELVDQVRQALRSDSAVKGLVAPNRIELYLPTTEQHLWSPQLVVDLTPAQEQGSLLEGRFTPHPNVWTLYVAATASLFFGALLAGSFGYVQWLMNQSPWALLLAVGACVCIVVLYFLSQLGQSLGHEQMDQLVAFLEEHAHPLARRSEEGDPVPPQAAIRRS